VSNVPASRFVGRISLGSYRGARRVYAKAFSLAIGGSFASFGRKTVLEPPVRIGGEQRMAIGNDVYIGADCWLQTHPGREGVVLRIGDGTSIAGHCVLSAACSITLGPRVLFARGVYVSDHSHDFADLERAVLDQPRTKLAPVEIGEGAWLGENVVVGPGVRIGRGAVVGANSVVLTDVPDHAVAVGAPARIVRVLAPSDEVDQLARADA
jgi:acetyltransferase-like isoleucine patch superfamily enzyme